MFDTKSLPHVIRYLATGLRTHVSARGCQSVVVELDGGMNSAVSLALLHQCGLETIGVTFQDDLENLSSQLSERFKITFVHIDRDQQPSLPHEKELQENFFEIWKFAWLDALARKFNGLVTHCIPRDDFRWIFQFNPRFMSVDLLPLAGLYFSEVQQIGKFLGVPDLPESSPSGIPYPQLEELCRVFSLYPYATREVVEQEYNWDIISEDSLNTYQRLAIKNRHLTTPEPFWCELQDFRK